MAFYDFCGQLEFSKGQRQTTDLDTIKAMIDGCASVQVADRNLDRQGIDYIATLRGGAEIFIDAKAREKGCSRFWKSGPEFALEDYSVVPRFPGDPGKAGWTLDESKKTHLILFTFDPSDTDDCFLVSFQLLRMAFRRNYRTWKDQYKNDTQQSNGWKSHCIFVPASVVLDAIQQTSKGKITHVSVSNPLYQWAMQNA